MKISKSFLGYKRENGRAGTRNHVIILPVDDISNACAEAVSNNIKGSVIKFLHALLIIFIFFAPEIFMGLQIILSKSLISEVISVKR